MKIFVLGIWAGLLGAQVGLDAPRFGCVVDAAGVGQELRGLQANLVAAPSLGSDVRVAACDEHLALVHRSGVVEANGIAVTEIEGQALIAVGGGRAVVLDVAGRRIVWYDGGEWHDSAARAPEGAISIALDRDVLRLMTREAVWALDLKTGAVVDSWTVRNGFHLASMLPNGKALLIQGREVSLCGSVGCESAFELPAEALSIAALNGEFQVAELAGGARAAVSAQGYFLLPGVAE